MKNYFVDCMTVEDVKKLYRTLAMKWHPDRGGDTATMQDINTQYTDALKRLDGTKTKGDDGKERTYTYDAVKEQQIMDKVQETLKAGIINDKVELWLIGTWIWVKGDTKHIRHILGKDGLGYRWHAKRACWYWQNDEYRHRYSKSGLDEIAFKYGATSFKSKVDNEITA